MSDGHAEMPPQIAEPFEGLLAFVNEHDEVLALYASALNATTGHGRLKEVLENLRGAAANSNAVKAAYDFEAECRREMERGFPLLVAHSVVALWSILEATIPEFVRQIILSRPALAEGASFQKLKIPAHQVLGKNADQVAIVVVEEIERLLRSQTRWGMGRFDELLAAVGVGPKSDDETRKDLFELSQVRNLIAHNRSVVDDKFVEACPWLSWRVGEKIPINMKDHARYSMAVRRYSADILESIKW